MQIIVAGMNHKTAPVEVREKFASVVERETELASSLTRRAGATEAMAFSTCNRFEVYCSCKKEDLDVEGMLESIDLISGLKFQKELCYVRVGQEALAHLFRVAAGLDAMAVGETQVLGQLKAAYGRAWDAGITGPVLHRAMHRAFVVARRVHTEGMLFSRPISMASIAASHAAGLVGDASASKAIVIGAGEMGKAAARRLVREGFAEVAIAARSAESAREAARLSGAVPLPWNEFPARMAASDVVVTATSAKKPILTSREMKCAREAGQSRPLHIIDLGSPRNVSPALCGATGVKLVSIDDLRPIAEKNLAERSESALRARAFVEEEARRFAVELGGCRATPAIAALARKFDSIREGEIVRLFRTHPDLSQRHREAVEQAAKAIVAKILHDPAEHLKKGMPGNEDLFASCGLIARMFKLPPF